MLESLNLSNYEEQIITKEGFVFRKLNDRHSGIGIDAGLRFNLGVLSVS